MVVTHWPNFNCILPQDSNAKGFMCSSKTFCLFTNAKFYHSTFICTRSLEKALPVQLLPPQGVTKLPHIHRSVQYGVIEMFTYMDCFTTLTL